MSSVPAPQADTQRLLDWAEQVIQQTHYEVLSSMALAPLDETAASVRPGDVVCLFQVSELVFRRETGCLEEMTTVLNALHACGACCLMLLQCHEGSCELYLGAVNKQKCDNPFYLSTIREILRGGLEGNMPGTLMTELVSRGEIEEKLRECLDNGFDSQCITAVSCVAGEAEDGKPLPGIERMVEAMGTKDFSLIVLADPVERGPIQQVRQGYEDLASQLSALENTSVSLQDSDSSSVSENFTTSFSTSISHGISRTQSHSVSSGWSKGAGSSTPGNGTADLLKKGAAVAAGVAAATLVPGGAEAVGVLARIAGNTQVGFFAMNAVTTLLGPPGQSTENTGTNGGTNDTTGIQTNENNAETEGQQKGVGASRTKTRGVTIQTTQRDRHISELIARVESYLQWLNHCENYGMFNCCAYIVSASAGVNLMAASQYQALMQGRTDVSQPVSINTWTRDNGVDQVRQSLLHLTHPAMDCLGQGDRFTPAMLMSSRELSRHVALPQKSVVGVSVMEYAAFGREVVRRGSMGFGPTARLGVVTHMGRANPGQPVLLDLQSMAAHTFVAGTNGSGKSNAIFRLLEELLAAGIPFMVIEPAKGEYKNMFGAADGVKVYGTNRLKMPLLRLNPFWFNEDVNVKEHIARLMDVFNASWPMYAAMPAVLNGAIENAYRACGWNLGTSRCSGPRVFPTVRDVLTAVTEKMESSAFSEEVRGNYVGALATRLESLCDGIFTDIFSGADLGDEALFGHSVIVDLSRAGSAEASAMIMGMLLIRLREYRMSEGALNHPLRHVTVLEEAHNLLRRTSAAQSPEGAGMMGKSVEMISNAIAEMRSYGDGFIIADQSPGLLDDSVLRNTNTKIILRLPEGRDRELVAATMGLDDGQTFELSRFRTGVCAIYQKDWLEPVLCQIDRASHREVPYQESPNQDQDDRDRRILAAGLLAPFTEAERPPADMEGLAMTVAMSGAQRKQLLRGLGGAEASRSWSCCAALTAGLIPLTMELPFSLSEDAVERWYRETVLTNELTDWDDPAALRGVFAANLTVRAKKDAQWWSLLPWFQPAGGGDVLAETRGLAFEVLLLGKKEPVAPETLEAWRRALDASFRQEDHVLAGLVERYASCGRPRQRDELTPYAGLAWCYAGEADGWEQGLPLLEAVAVEEWDKLARERLAQQVHCGGGTATELLSLALQHWGAEPAVRKFYYRWLAYARGREIHSREAACVGAGG